MVKGTEKKLVSLTFPVYKFNTKQFIGTSFVQMKTGERYFAILNKHNELSIFKDEESKITDTKIHIKNVKLFGIGVVLCYLTFDNKLFVQRIRTNTSKEIKFKNPGSIYHIEVCQNACFMFTKNGSKRNVFVRGQDSNNNTGVSETESDFTSVFEIEEYKNLNVVKTDTGYASLMILTDTGDVYGHGYSYHGELSNIDTELVKGKKLTGFNKPIIDISCGVFTSFYLTKDFELYGTGLITGNDNYSPVLIDTNITNFVCGYETSYYFKDGNLRVLLDKGKMDLIEYHTDDKLSSLKLCEFKDSTILFNFEVNDTTLQDNILKHLNIHSKFRDVSIKFQ